MELQTLWPLSEGEILGHREEFVDACFQSSMRIRVETVEWHELVEHMVRGGYPEAVRRTDPRRRRAWWTSYVASLLERDVRDLSNIEGLREMPRLLEILAARAGGLLNYAELSRAAGISASSLKRYVGLFRALYLHVEVPAWFRHLERRLVKSPKSYLNDTGLLCHLRGTDARGLLEDRNRAGTVLENFVVMEIQKQMGWSSVMPRMYHFRDASGNEVDIVLEAPDGRLVGIEVKASAQVDTGDFAGLRVLETLVGKNFVRGLVLYAGGERLAFGDRLMALPLACLWKH
jgi:predicted AAA+ superfamily ATPase